MMYTHFQNYAATGRGPEPVTKPSRMRGESGGLSRRSGRHCTQPAPRGPAHPCPGSPRPARGAPSSKPTLWLPDPGSGVRGGAPAAGSPAHLPFTLGGRFRLAGSPGPAAVGPAPRPEPRPRSPPRRSWGMRCGGGADPAPGSARRETP